MVRRQRGRWWICWKELDIQGVRLVDGYHRFAVVVQILEEDLAQSVQLPGVR